MNHSGMYMYTHIAHLSLSYTHTRYMCTCISEDIPCFENSLIVSELIDKAIVGIDNTPPALDVSESFL